MAIVKEISLLELETLKLSNFKAHIEAVIPNAAIVTDTWTSMASRTYPWVEVKTENYGDVFELSSDMASVIVKKPCLISFNGCVHFRNNSASAYNIELGFRIVQNGNDEARCSQTFFGDRLQGTVGEESMRYAGSADIVKPNEYITLQYYLVTGASVDIDFTSNALFDDSIAATIAVHVAGLPAYTKKNEKIEWKITN